MSNLQYRSIGHGHLTLTLTLTLTMWHKRVLSRLGLFMPRSLGCIQSFNPFIWPTTNKQLYRRCKWTWWSRYNLAHADCRFDDYLFFHTHCLHVFFDSSIYACIAFFFPWRVDGEDSVLFLGQLCLLSGLLVGGTTDIAARHVHEDIILSPVNGKKICIEVTSVWYDMYVY